jgi:uncharacterized protein (DUF433 family)
VLDWNQCPAVERVSGKVGGVWLFKGTRVPVMALFENLDAGARASTISLSGSLVCRAGMSN